jgi:hypothetical protein
MRNELGINQNIEPMVMTLSENNKLSDEDIKKVYNGLNGNSEIDKIKSAEEITDSEDNMAELTEMESVPVLNGIPEDGNDIQESEKNLDDVLSNYATSPEDIATLHEIIIKYKDGEYENKNLYNDLPESMQNIINSVTMNETPTHLSKSAYNQLKAARNYAAKLLMDDIISDAKMNAIFDEYENGKREIMEYVQQSSQGLIKEATDDVIARIDQLKELHPDKAEVFEKMKSAFVGEVDFSRQIEILNKTSNKKLNKMADRLRDEMLYFNTKVNSNIANVKVPDILEILQLLELALPQYDEDTIKKFVLLICRTIYGINVAESFDDFIYIYRLVNSLYRYKFVNIEGEDQEKEELFDKVSEVMDKIKSH